LDSNSNFGQFGLQCRERTRETLSDIHQSLRAMDGFYTSGIASVVELTM
jgi:hypothetical protein